MYRLLTLGTLRLDGPSGEVRVLRRKERILLAYLVRRGPARVRRDELVALLWGEHPEARARQSLRQAVFALRQVLGDAIEVDSETVRLRPGTVELDLTALQEAVRQEQPLGAMATWGGEFLAGTEYGDDGSLQAWVDAERAALRPLLEGALDALEARVGEPSEPCSADEYLVLARRWADANPCAERAHARVVRALRNAGRIDEAGAWHSVFTERVRSEPGAEPSAAFLALGAELAAARRRPAADAASDDTTDGTVGANGALVSVARERSLAAVHDAWRTADAGAGLLVLVQSEARDERTRFAEELVRAVQSDQPSAVVLHARPSSGSPGPWSGAARLLASVRHARGLSAVEDVALAELAPLVPAIRERYPALPQPAGGAAAIRAAAAQTLAEIAFEAPVLVVAEDAPTFDVETRRWLAELAASLPERVLLVVTSDGVALNRDVELQTLRNAPGARVVVLSEGAGSADFAPPLVREEHDGPATPAIRPAPGLESAGIVARQGVGGWRPAGVGAALLASAILAGAALFGVIGFLAARRVDAPPVVAVGAVNALGTESDDPTARALPEILSTHLASVPGLDVVSRARMHELLARSSGELSAARLARAGHIVEGELHGRGGSGYRLELRRVDVRSGHVLETYAAEAEDPLRVAHLAATAIARSLGFADPPVTEYAVGAIGARALYEEGLQAFYRGDYSAAFQLFTTALERDTSFAMAAFYAFRSALYGERHDIDFQQLLARAVALADNGPDRDRLMILAHAALELRDPTGVAVAETLAVRYPSDPAGHFVFGSALTSTGRFLEAVPHLRLALSLDPPGTDVEAFPCTACAAYHALVAAYWHADSLPTAVPVAWEWTEVYPEDVTAVATLASLLESLERYDEELPVRQQLARLRRDHAAEVLAEARVAIRKGDFDAADTALSYLAGAANRERNAAWVQVISFRNQGRYEEAWDAATRYRNLAREEDLPLHPSAVPQAVVLQETGRAREAAALFDTVYHSIGDRGRPSRTASDRAWLLTLRASALAAAGDTAWLASLADNVQALGRQSAYGRDPLLHHHVRGLLLVARGDPAMAEHEFRAAMFSPVGGYTRTNLELARVLIELGRPAEAVPLLQAALRAPVDGPALYVTRTETHRMLALAFDAASMAEKASVHYRATLDAWRGADPVVQPHVEELRRRPRWPDQ